MATNAYAAQSAKTPLAPHTITRREAAILPLGAHARRAMVAACSPEVWPPA